MDPNNSVIKRLWCIHLAWPNYTSDICTMAMGYIEIPLAYKVCQGVNSFCFFHVCVCVCLSICLSKLFLSDSYIETTAGTNLKIGTSVLLVTDKP